MRQRRQHRFSREASHDGGPDRARGDGTSPTHSGGVVRRVLVTGAAALALALAQPAGLAAQEGHGGHAHDHGDAGHHEGLHFTHPLIAESVSPDTKVRLDYQYFEFPDGDTENSGVFEAEYAVARSFSVEAGIPFSYTEGEPGNLEAKLKFANFAFEDIGLLLGYGAEVVFPTNGDPGGEAGEEGEASELALSRSGGSGAFPPPRFSGGGGGVAGSLGTDEWEVAPFLNIGWKRGPVELVGWGFFGIPFDQAEQSEVATELSWNFSGMYHFSSRVQGLVEFDGSGGISGEAVGEDVANVSPGLRVQVLPDTPLVLGSSVGFPLTDEEPFDVRLKTSVFWHFPR